MAAIPIPELKHFYRHETLDVAELVIPPDRIREEVGDLTELVTSLQEVGQLVPIVVNTIRELAPDKPYDYELTYELIDGFRRVAAFKELGWKRIGKINLYDLTDADLFQIELHTNIVRKQLNPAEKADAISKLHEMRQTEFGVTTPRGVREVGEGTPKLVPATRDVKGWSQEDTAEALGVSQSSVSRAVVISKALKQYPQLRASKSEDDILRRLRKIRMDEAMTQMAAITGKEERESEEPIVSVEIIHGDSLTEVPKLRDGRYDVAFLDPPYGVDVEQTHRSSSAWEEMFMDDKDSAHITTKLVLERLYPKMAENSMIFVFAAHQFSTLIQGMMENVGFDVDDVPLIWHRTGPQGPTMQVRKWFSRAHETIVYGHKGLKPILRQGNNVIPCDVVTPGKKVHPTEKPIGLYLELLRRVALPGQWLIDPFGGAGTAGRAALRAGLNATIIEIEAKYVGAARYLIHGEKPEVEAVLDSELAADTEAGAEEVSHEEATTEPGSETEEP